MKRIDSPVYYCDYCRKHMLSASAMSVHEKKCMANPNNFRACTDCIFLEQTKVTYTVEYQTGISSFSYADKKATGFMCTKLNLMLYHVKAELKGLPEKWPETFEGQMPMPKECADRMTYDDLPVEPFIF